MPLWGRKLYQAGHNEKNKKLKSPKFRIPFTGEDFDSEKEYREQLGLYQQPLWTCQSTGNSGLSYEKACASEAHHRALIDKNIPTSMQKAILQFIHHNSGSLDSLVEEAEDHFENNFHVGEVVELAKCRGKIIKGKILQVKTGMTEGCNGSPSSDKENHGVEPELSQQTAKPSKSAAVQHYNIQIGGKSGKVISSVPAEDLIRCDDLPPPYLIKLLIRSNALQAGTKSNSPWVVSPEMVKAFEIRSKLMETMLPSTRISISGLKGASKRKSAMTSLGGQQQQQQQPSKKRRLENGSCDPPAAGVAAANGPRTPTKGGKAAPADSDQEAELSPEKVFLDHSYSSPTSKASRSPTSPKENIKSPSSSSKPARKQSTLEAAFSSKKVWRPLSGKKESREVKDEARASKSKKESKPEKIDKKINVVNSDSSSEDSSSEDSDVVLMDLHVKLSPIKNKSLPAPMRRTLADHFLSLGKDKQGGGKRDEETKKVSTTSKAQKRASPVKETKLKQKKKSRSDAKSIKKQIRPKKERTEVIEIDVSGDSSDSGSSDPEIPRVEGGRKNKLKRKSPRKMIKAKANSHRTGKSNSAAKVVKKESGISQQGSVSPKPDPGFSPLKSSPKKEVLSTPGKSPVKAASSKLHSPAKSFKSSPRKTLSQLARELNKKKTSKSTAKLEHRSPTKGRSPLKTANKGSPKKAVAGKKTPTKQKVSPKKTPKSKSLKQSTLFKFSSAKKRSQTGDSDDDALILYKLAKPAPTPVSPRDPPIALKIMRAKRQNNRMLYTRLVGQAAKILSKKQIQALKPSIQGDVMSRAQAMEAKKKWDGMTPEEKAKVLEGKRRERLKKREAERKTKQLAEKEKAKRFEDQLLDSKPLVTPKPVPLPEGLPNTLFGDIAMVVEFLNCFGDFLMPNDPYPITADNFIQALVCGKEGFAYLSRMLVILLKTLLQDQITEEFVELGMKLSDIPVNMHTASELLRLSLLQTDTDMEDGNDDDSDTSSVSQEEGEFTAPQELVEVLETSEFFSLTPEQKLELMVCLCNRILTTYSLVDYMEGKQRNAAKLWVKKMQTLKEKNDVLKEEKKKRREERLAAQKQKEEEKMKEKDDKENSGGTDKKKPAVKKAHKKNAPKKETPPPAAVPPPAEEPADLASVVKRRRVMTAKAKLEQVELAKKDLERRRQEQEEMRILKERQTFEKNFEEGIRLAKLALRHLPIGTDRNHSRYWVFSTVTPGLFIEKGWVNQNIDYSTAASADEEDDGGMVHGLQKSIPKEGQNLWFQYETVEEFESLLECLNNAGIRESALHAELKKRYGDVRKLIVQARRASQKLRDSDGDKDLLDSFKEDLRDIETHISQGNLGGVASYEKWGSKVDGAKTIKDFVPLLLQSQSSVNVKFLESIMSPPKVKEGEEPEEERVTEKVSKWRDAVNSSVTMSRLHVLLSIFEVCVKWEKSSENAKCKICRKKGDSTQIILCDECNQPFHLFCLRPALSAIPTQKWSCPSCAPLEQRPGRKRNYKELAGSDEEESEESEEEESEDADSDSYGDDGDPECCICGAPGEETAVCSQCHSAYHKDCHQPPMRNLPRTEWTCYSCRNGRSRGKGKGKARRGRKRGRPSRR